MTSTEWRLMLSHAGLLSSKTTPGCLHLSPPGHRQSVTRVYLRKAPCGLLEETLLHVIPLTSVASWSSAALGPMLG